MKSGTRRMYFFVLASVLSPLLLVTVVALILGHYAISVDALSWLVVAGTIELALMAGLQDRIRGWLMAPELDVEVSPPDFHCTYDNGSRVYYSRFQVHNKGEASAEKVEVMLKRVYRKEGESFRVDDSITPDNLLWSMIGRYDTIPNINPFGMLRYIRKFIPAIYCDYIAPGTRKHCTLGHIYEPGHRDDDEYGMPRFQVPATEAVFCLEVSFKSNLRNYFLSKGTYGIELQVAASNAKATSKRFRIEVTGNWSPDETTMVREGFRIEEVKYDFEKYVEKVVSKGEDRSKPEAGLPDKEKPAAETTAGSQQPSTGGATPQTVTSQDKKEKEETT